jgi:hypothetical protein
MFCGLLAATASLFGQTGDETGGRWAILVAGVSGDPQLQQEYLKQLKDMDAILEKPLGFPHQHVFVLFDDPSRDPAFVQYKSTREELEKVCRTVAAQSGKGDLVFVLILGHGSMDGDDYKLNLVGPDPTGAVLASMLNEIPAQRSIVINTTNCSGGSVAALARKGRIVVTATKTGSEKNQTHLAEYFIQAFKDNKADTDKDGRVSLLEAFQYASQMVQTRYSNEGTLQTEHPQLDDSGDGQGQANPAPENGEGLLARTTYLDTGSVLFARNGLSPEEQAMAREADSLQKQIETLKYAKSQMPQEEYEKKLEELLLKLAQVNAKMRKK